MGNVAAKEGGKKVRIDGGMKQRKRGSWTVAKHFFVLNRNLLGLNQNELFVLSAETVKWGEDYRSNL